MSNNRYSGGIIVTDWRLQRLERNYQLAVICLHKAFKADSESTVVGQEKGLGWFL